MYSKRPRTDTHIFCNQCQQMRPFADYTKRKGGHLGLQSWCRHCQQRRRDVYLAKNPHKRKRWVKNSYDRIRATPAKLATVKARARAAYHRKKHTDGYKTSYRRMHLRRFGITPADYQRMYDAQGGRCYICRYKDKQNKWDTLCVDHNHATGQVRHLLCRSCNSAIGYAQENQAILLKMLFYLREYETPQQQDARTASEVCTPLFSGNISQNVND